MNNKHKQILSEIVESSVIFHEETSRKIDDLCNDKNFGFREASQLSHIADRLDLFLNELADFYHRNNN